ncbi:hypothetical protein D3C87_1287220 [compost metagenome]
MDAFGELQQVNRLAQSVGRGHQRERIRQDVRDGQRRAPLCQLMIGRRQQTDRVLAADATAQPGIDGRVVGQPDMRGVGRHRFHHLVHRSHIDADVDLRICDAERSDHVFHEAVDEALADHQVDVAALHAPQLLQARVQVLLLRAAAPVIFQQHVRRFGGRQPARAALEQLHPQLLFQQLDLAADDGSRRVELVGRAPYRAASHDLVEVLQADLADFLHIPVFLLRGPLRPLIDASPFRCP